MLCEYVLTLRYWRVRCEACGAESPAMTGKAETRKLATQMGWVYMATVQGVRELCPACRRVALAEERAKQKALGVHHE